jgi:uncharacterized membrane protein
VNIFMLLVFCLIIADNLIIGSLSISLIQ